MAENKRATLTNFLRKTVIFSQKLSIFQLFRVGYFFKTKFVSLIQTKSVQNIIQELFSELDYHFLKQKYDVFFGGTLRVIPCISALRPTSQS